MFENKRNWNCDVGLDARQILITHKAPMTCGKTSNYAWVLVMCGKNFRLRSEVEDVWEQLLITHREVSILESQCGCSVNVKYTEENEKTYIFCHIGNAKGPVSI